MNESLNNFIKSLIDERSNSSQLCYLNVNLGIKMGRIPKAEKVKAIETLQKEPTDGDAEVDEFLKETETSYLKRFEKRQELDKNLKALAENVLKVSSSSSSLTNNSKNNNSSSCSLATGETQPSRKVQQTGEDEEEEEECEGEAQEAEATSASALTTAEKVDRPRVTMNGNEDYMSRFLELLFDQQKQEALRETKAAGNMLESSSRETSLLIKNLLNLHKPLKQVSVNSSLIPKTTYCSLFMNSFNAYDANYFLVSSLINDRVYQVFNEHTKHIDYYQERARYLIQNRITVFDGHDLELEKVWNSLVESIPEFVKLVIKFAKQVPGLCQLEENDFGVIINNKLFDFFIITNSVLFIDGESYLYLPNNIQYTRHWMSKIKSVPVTDKLFSFVEDLNALFLTNKEKALLITLLLTMPDVELAQPEALSDLNEFYTRALLYEFDINKRDYSFMNRFKHVLNKLKENRVLQAAE